MYPSGHRAGTTDRGIIFIGKQYRSGKPGTTADEPTLDARQAAGPPLRLPQRNFPRFRLRPIKVCVLSYSYVPTVVERALGAFRRGKRAERRREPGAAAAGAGGGALAYGGAAHLLPVSPSGESLDGLDTGVLDLTFDDDSFVSALSCLPHPGHDDGAVPPSCAGAR